MLADAGNVKSQKPPGAVDPTAPAAIMATRPRDWSRKTAMAKATKKLSYEAAAARLDEIVALIESGEAGLEESITLYEEAMKLAAQCRKTLDAFEQRIQKIQADAAGKLEIRPFDADAQPPDVEDET
jgi:exodeoxyribonuclease VII small subunit